MSYQNVGFMDSRYKCAVESCGNTTFETDFCESHREFRLWPQGIGHTHPRNGMYQSDRSIVTYQARASASQMPRYASREPLMAPLPANQSYQHPPHLAQDRCNNMPRFAPQRPLEVEPPAFPIWGHTFQPQGPTVGHYENGSGGPTWHRVESHSTALPPLKSFARVETRENFVHRTPEITMQKHVGALPAIHSIDQGGVLGQHMAATMTYYNKIQAQMHGGREPSPPQFSSESPPAHRPSERRAVPTMPTSNLPNGSHVVVSVVADRSVRSVRYRSAPDPPHPSSKSQHNAHPSAPTQPSLIDPGSRDFQRSTKRKLGDTDESELLLSKNAPPLRSASGSIVREIRHDISFQVDAPSASMRAPLKGQHSTETLSKPIAEGRHIESHSPATVSNPGSVAKRTTRISRFDSTAFDTLIYQQEGASKPPDGVCISLPTSPGAEGGAEQYHLHINPLIHRPYTRTQVWQDKKDQDIRARGGRKAWFGKVAERQRWLRSKDKFPQETPPILGERRDPDPSSYKRPLDFADISQEALPNHVLANPAWVKACEWHREVRQKRELRQRERQRQEEQTRQFFQRVLRT